MKKVIFTLLFSLISLVSFSQEVAPKSPPLDSTKFTYYSIDTGRMVDFYAPVYREDLKRINTCYGYYFTNSKGEPVAYTPCMDRTLERLVILDTLQFIQGIKSNKLSFK